MNLPLKSLADLSRRFPIPKPLLLLLNTVNGTETKLANNH